MIAPLTQFRTMLFFVWWFACLSLDQVVSCSSQRKKCSTRKTCCSYGLETVQRGLDKAFGVVVWYSWQMHFTLTVCWFQKTINQMVVMTFHACFHMEYQYSHDEDVSWKGQHARRPSLLALQDVRFSVRGKTLDESGNGFPGSGTSNDDQCQTPCRPLAGSRKPRSYTFLRVKKRSCRSAN